MATCQFCGESFGNEGAKTTHEKSCDRNPENQKPVQTNAEPGFDGANLPIDAEQAATGAELADSLQKATSENPVVRAEGRENLLKSGVALVAKAGTGYIQRNLEKKQNAKQAKDIGVQLEKSDEYLRCPECNEQITEIGSDTLEITCSGCGEVLRLVSPEGPE